MRKWLCSVVLACVGWSATLGDAAAQPKLPQPEVPKPELPALPSSEDVPPIPKAPALPALKAPQGPLPADAPPVVSPQGPSASVEGPPEDIDIQVDDRKPEPGDGLPGTLPNPLRNNARVRSRMAVQQKAGGALTIEEIVNPPVSSVSNHVEGALSAPAFIIHLTRKELEDRGYTDLSQVLDDLPGIDIVRPYGPEYARAYWRGYRSGTGDDPYLILLDGLPFSSLFFRDAKMLTAFPLSDIDHIEVVYGPASIAHGANASAGVINVITNDGAAAQQAGEFGSNLALRATYGGAQRNLTSFADGSKIVDATARWINKDFRLRVTARLERSTLDRSIGDDFEFTRPSYYRDAGIWGDAVLATYPQLAGDFRSNDDKLALDGRLWVGRFEFGAAAFAHTTGLGTMAAGDRLQNEPPWTTRETSIFIRHATQLLPGFSSATVLRYRQSELAPPTSLLLRVASPTGFLEPGPRLLGLAVHNRAYELAQQFDIEVAHDLIRKGDILLIETGFMFRHLEIANGVEVQANTLFPAGDVSAALDQTMPGSGLDTDARAHQRADEGGIFALGRYEVAEDHWLHVGARVEHQTYTDSTNLLFRAGYVGTFEPVTVKALYGEGTQTPSPSDIVLGPQPTPAGTTTPKDNMVARSVEANASLTIAPFSVNLAGWLAHYRDPIIDGQELDDRMAIGLDAGARMALRPFQVWLYYSHYFHAEEEPSGSAESRPIGDLARDKIWAGVTYDRGNFTATLLGRFMGRRHPVETNPIGAIDPYLTLDANIALRNLVLEGTRISLRCANLLDARYRHPGIGTADSGETPGAFAEDGSYTGSGGIFNSAHPQPRRSVMLTLALDM
jgi:outer membrane receptor protein involved in Fe transport